MSVDANNNVSTQPVSPSNVNWADFNYPTASAVLRTRVLRAADLGFFLLTAFSGGATLVSATSYTGTAIEVTTRVFGLGALTTALATAGAFFNRNKPADNSPNTLRTQSEQAGNDIVGRKLGFAEIVALYGHLIDSKLININAIQDILHGDAENLATFKQRHGDFDAAYRFCRQDTKTILKARVLDELVHDTRSILELLSSADCQTVGVTDIEIVPLIYEREVEYVDSYELFLERGGAYLLPGVIKAEAKAKLAQLFLRFLQSKNIDLGASHTVQARFWQECVLGNNVPETVLRQAFEQQKQKFLAGTISYEQFRSQNDLAMLMEADVVAVRAQFLTQPIEVISRQEYAQDLVTLGIDEREIRELYIGQMNERADQLATYLGENGFKARYGTRLVEMEKVSFSNCKRWKEEIIAQMVKAKNVCDSIKLCPELFIHKIVEPETIAERLENELLAIKRIDELFAVDFALVLLILPRENATVQRLFTTREEIAATQEAQSRSRLMIQSAQESVRSESQNLNRLRQHLAEFQSSTVLFQGEIAGLLLSVARLSSLKTLYESEKRTFDRVNRATSREIDTKLASHKEAIDALRSKLESIAQQVQEQKSRLESLEQLMQRLEKIAGFAKRRAEIQKELAETQEKRTKQVTGIVQALRNLPKWSTSKIERELEEMTREEKECSELTQALAVQTNATSELKAAKLCLSKLQHQQAELKKEVSQKEKLAEQIEAQIKDRHNFSLHQQQYQQSESEYNQAIQNQSVLSVKQSELETLLNRIDEIRAKIAQGERHLADAERALRQAQRTQRDQESQQQLLLISMQKLSIA